MSTEEHAAKPNVTALRLYGDKPRCFWCGKRVAGEPQSLLIQSGKERYECIVCSPTCEQATIRACAYVKRFIPLFFVGLVTSVLLTVIPKFPTMLFGLCLLGITIIVCPFCTPQTTMALGMKKSFALGRLIGSVVFAVSLFLLISRTLR